MAVPRSVALGFHCALAHCPPADVKTLSVTSLTTNSEGSEECHMPQFWADQAAENILQVRHRGPNSFEKSRLPPGRPVSSQHKPPIQPGYLSVGLSVSPCLRQGIVGAEVYVYRPRWAESIRSNSLPTTMAVPRSVALGFETETAFCKSQSVTRSRPTVMGAPERVTPVSRGAFRPVIDMRARNEFGSICATRA
jgi:hypothetical protein